MGRPLSSRKSPINYFQSEISPIVPASTNPSNNYSHLDYCQSGENSTWGTPKLLLLNLIAAIEKNVTQMHWTWYKMLTGRFYVSSLKTWGWQVILSHKKQLCTFLYFSCNWTKTIISGVVQYKVKTKIIWMQGYGIWLRCVGSGIIIKAAINLFLFVCLQWSHQVKLFVLYRSLQQRPQLHRQLIQL